MQREICYDKLEHFLENIKLLGITKLAFAETREKRPMQVGPELLQVVDIALLEILAYNRPTIYKCKLFDADFDGIHDRLVAEGFEIARRSRNIT
ncbi:MAG TPA: hypothetical protein VLM75_09505 [Spirochaetota bacterium]|nr:hypothetical protein [Spirochaetota bacterium]